MTPDRRHQNRSGDSIVNFEYISHLFLVLLLLAVNMYFFAGKGYSFSFGWTVLHLLSFTLLESNLKQKLNRKICPPGNTFNMLLNEKEIAKLSKFIVQTD